MKSFKIFVKKLNESNDIEVPDFVIAFLNENNVPNKYRNIIINIIYKQMIYIRDVDSYFSESEITIRIKKIYKWIIRHYTKYDLLVSILNFLKEDNKPILNIKNLQKDDFFTKLEEFKQIRDWSIATNTIVKNMKWEDAINRAEEWHQSLKANGGKIENEKGYIKFKYDDGYYWIDLQTCEDKDEADSMGHCGVAQDGNVLYSLRKNKIPHITLEYNPKTKHIIQCRGGANSKPKEKYHKYIVDFIIKNIVTVVETPFYKPLNNFSLTDLNKKLLQKLFIQAEGLSILTFFTFANSKEYIIDDIYYLISKQKEMTDKNEILKWINKIQSIIFMYIMNNNNDNNQQIFIMKRNLEYFNSIIKKLEQ